MSVTIGSVTRTTPSVASSSKDADTARLKALPRKSKHDTHATVTVALALPFRIRERRVYSFLDANKEFGMALRTYRQYIARLRAAGLLLDAPNVGGKIAEGLTRDAGLVRYLGYDAELADVGIA